jgi:hypothetical protein
VVFVSLAKAFDSFIHPFLHKCMATAFGFHGFDLDITQLHDECKGSSCWQ